MRTLAKRMSALAAVTAVTCTLSAVPAYAIPRCVNNPNPGPVCFVN